MKDTKSIIGRYVLFAISLLFAGMGISLIAISDLGASAVSSPAFVASLVFPLSFGTFTFIANLTFFLLQIVLLRSQFPKREYTQLIVVPLAGVFIDLGMILFGGIQPNTYFGQLLVLLIGIAVLAFGITLQIRANAITNPAEGIVKAMAQKTGKSFGTLKTQFDVFLVVFAVALSLIGLGTIQGVREGTVLAALLVGPMINVFNKLIDAVTANKEGKLEASTESN